MLVRLLIKNYALIRHLEIKPSAGLNTITGETGAGKSIMLGAMGLLLGNRADGKALLSADEKCVIEGEFKIGEYQLGPVFKEEDVDYEETTILRREITSSGKSRAFINDSPVRLDVMRKVGDFLVDIHSQHDNLLLADRYFQLNLIDTFAGSESLLETYKICYSTYKNAETHYEQLYAQAHEMRREYDFNRFQYDELINANLISGQQEELEKELQVLEHTEEIKTELNQALEILDRSECSMISQANALQSALVKLAGIVSRYDDLSQRASGLFIELKELLRDIESEENQVEIDPERAEEISERLGLFYRLQQKHGIQSVDQLLTIQQELEEKVGKVENLDDTLAMAEKARDEALAAVNQAGNKLSEKRLRALPDIEKNIATLLAGLSMPDARLDIRHALSAPGPLGTDLISLLFSANKGVAPEELRKVASGGEFSRLMFCVKYLMAGKTALPTIIFDEIDTGISGEIAQKLGLMMQQMGKVHQVITITHLPQIAARGNTHYFVYKDQHHEGVASKIKTLD
ncbi:MAG: DNA repair protein RecN, partial [Cyclobacteriaceae bacterium]|nr:DNA repair protein RecN [Cyclobacteriaceae bacterium]